MKKYISTIILSFLLILLISGCKKEEPEPEPKNTEIREATDVNKFIYNGLATYYLWEANVPALNNVKYQNNDSLNVFLNKYSDPEDLFYDLLYQYAKIDKWSFIVDNAQEIENWINAISESMGMDFRLYYLNESGDDLIGVIRYVLKDSPAEKAGLKRGNLFLTVNGQQLTVTNYMTLMFTLKSYTLGLASYNGSSFTVNGKTASMTAVMLQENPVYLDTVLNINNTRVGYLVYNAFTASYDSLIKSSYDIELNKVFGKFKSDGIQMMILDLRYNGGGVVRTAEYLASMIYSTDTQKIFSITQYNSLLQSYFQQKYGDEVFNDYFYGNISETDKMPAVSINSLGLSQVYIITTTESASASELLINGLKPYITVTQVGTNTAGKYVGSWTITDVDEEGYVNPNHSWAMQPIIFKTANSQNVSDFVDGLKPDISAVERASGLLPFGDPNEPLLKACLDHIKGLKSAPGKKGADLRGFKSSDDFSPFAGTMVDDNILPGNLPRY
ncbi:MAG: hypothetical protein A2V46_08330 [Bacteroidetes bacterium RBG_19FT_COMBO_42_7]|nr:MAG: hypothetical protein A2V46_08330 [Bacteroidetes bacterium RBG_19FT_COMBO_42_7]